MKLTPKYFALICSLTFPIFAQADRISQNQSINLTNATVYLKGAELLGNVTVNIPQGESEVVLSNIAGEINPESLSIFAEHDVLVLSSQITRDYREKESFSGEIQNIQDQIDRLKESKTKEEIKLKTNNASFTVIENSKNLERTKDNALSVNEIHDLIVLVEKKTEAILTDNAEIEKRLEEINKELAQFEQLLAATQQKGVVPGSRIKVKLQSPRAITTQLNIAYVTENAGWVPTYDIHATNVNEPIQLSYKAKIYQNSGINWDNVNITLSSGNPSQNREIPTFHPWFLSEYQPPQPIARDRQNIAIHESNDHLSLELYESAKVASVAYKPEEKKERLEKPISDYVVADNAGIYTQYQINLPYTIPSDGKTHMIFIQQEALEADYQYIAMPKWDNEVFLQATINDWQNLNLLPGTTTVYFENHYVGQGAINLDEIKNGLNLSLGVENRISVKREEIKTEGATGIFGGNNIERKQGYLFTAINARPDTVQLTIIDQLPVSQNEKIKIQDLQLQDAEHNAVNGKLSWQLELKPQETKNFEYHYKIRYPKEMNVTGLQFLK